jgi:hypothetical protein
VDPDVVHRDDVGVVERAGQPRLLLEAAEEAGVSSQRLAHDLDRHLALQPAVAGG